MGLYGNREPFDIDVLREILWQGMTNEEYRNFQNLEEDFDEAQEPIEEVFDEERTPCFRLLWAAQVAKMDNQTTTLNLHANQNIG